MFEMSDEFFPGLGASALQIGTPAVLSMAPIDGALAPVEEAGWTQCARKSLAMTEFLMAAIDGELAEFGFELGTPREAKRRGGHVSVRHEHAQPMCLALRARRRCPGFPQSQM
jgi:kynureninase